MHRSDWLFRRSTLSSDKIVRIDNTREGRPITYSCFYTGGMNVFTAPLVLAGGTSIVCRAFEPEEVLARVPSKQVTIFFGVPTMFFGLSQSSAFAQGALGHCGLASVEERRVPSRFLEGRKSAGGIRSRQGDHGHVEWQQRIRREALQSSPGCT